MTISQRDSVIEATEKVLDAHGITRQPDQKITDVASNDLRQEVVELVIKDFDSGRVALRATESNKAKLLDKKLLRKYVAGLVVDRWTKDSALNGGSRNRQPKKEQVDIQLTELEKLREICDEQDNDAAVSIVDSYIEARREKLSKDSLPDELRYLKEE